MQSDKKYSALFKIKLQYPIATFQQILRDSTKKNCRGSDSQSCHAIIYGAFLIANPRNHNKSRLVIVFAHSLDDHFGLHGILLQRFQMSLSPSSSFFCLQQQKTNKWIRNKHRSLVVLSCTQCCQQTCVPAKLFVQLAIAFSLPRWVLSPVGKPTCISTQTGGMYHTQRN